MRLKCHVESLLPFLQHLVRTAEVDIGWRQHGDALVSVVVVVPIEELTEELLCVAEVTEARWEVGLVFQSLEMPLRVRVVVRYPGS